MRSVQEHLGHSKVAMTERYTHLQLDYQRAQLDKMGDLLGEVVGANGSKILVEKWVDSGYRGNQSIYNTLNLITKFAI